jgi:2-polyprenyl-6-methoxyphenol hydroxylase-like FAD-dependent oxidoreductase
LGIGAFCHRLATPRDTLALMVVGERAVVLGAGMAGLVTARVLAERFERVALVERDQLPAPGQGRPGVPQERHVHGLLCSGSRILEGLLPGLTADLVRDGALTGDPGEDCRWFNGGAYACRGRSGLEGIAVTRSLLEGHVRRRVLALPALDLVEGHAGRGLEAEAGGPVTGVRIAPRDGGAERVLGADLVVDATGRGSRAPGWLEALGFDPPPDERVVVGLGYATRLFHRSPGDLGGDYLVNVAAQPPNRRLGVALAVEDERWMVTLAGMLGDHPPGDPEGFLSFAAGLPVPEIHDLVRGLEPLGGAALTRFPAHRRRRYERLRRRPERFVVLGDALCSFNPVYGQGMSVAAREAVLLGAALGGGLDGLPSRFFRAAAPVVDVPWAIAVGNDLRFREVEGPRGPRVRLLNRYISRLHRAASRDPVVAGSFHRVAHLVEPPRTLLRPRLALRVLVGPPRRPKLLA